jgi:hypothetical protein
MRLLLSRRGLELPDAAAVDLYAGTDGNAELVMLAVDTLRRTKEPACVISRLGESEQVEQFLVKRVDEGLSDEERGVMSTMAVLIGYPGTRNAYWGRAGWSQRAAADQRFGQPVTPHGGRENGKEYSLNAMARAYYYDLIGQRERQAMHRRAGEYYEAEEPDALRAALHLEAANEIERAVRLATADVSALINRGQARVLRPLPERFTAKQMDAQQWIEVNLARGQVYTLQGESSLARESYQAALSALATLPGSPAVQEIKARVCEGMGDLLRYESPRGQER